MKVNANTLRPGHAIEHQGKHYLITKYELILPGKGNAFIAVDMRDVRTGTKTNERFRTQESVEKLMTEERECTMLFGEGDRITLMDSEIVETEPVVKGQTASSSYKPAVLENGVKTLVPPHIEMGTRIVVATADSSYVERAKD